ncbi:MAG: hypothetical protein QHC67_17880 [Sphingobium sp.]|uniref:HipA family kinase n=1 Tax=Sphingobium sp. TaxID=1912891 RepID=UPI0029B5DDEF|nr:HipA family kinase [Sphingobium sp.]MDX3911653.1 hypothetical protein [Sphingobium sp.]
MLNCGRFWQPVAINRVIQPILSSTQVVKVATDLGVGFLKGMGNPAGNESLAQELVGSELACAMGLRVPVFAVINVEGIDIQMESAGPIAFGPAFISRELRGSTSAGEDTFVRRLTNPEDIARLVVFDTWVRNLDRCPPADYLDPRPNRDNLFFTPVRRKFEMVVFDHTHCFVEEDLESGLAGAHFVGDDRVYGAFPEFKDFLTARALRNALADLARIDGSVIREIVRAVPQPWGPTTAVRDRWIEQLMGRQQRVGDYVFNRLVPQIEMKV